LLFNESSLHLKRNLELLAPRLNDDLYLIVIVSPEQMGIADSFRERFGGIVGISVFSPSNHESIESRVLYLRSRFKADHGLILINKILDSPELKEGLDGPEALNRWIKLSSELQVRAPYVPGMVSVVVYNYNYGEYIEACLESIFRQTYRNFEVCISDNASSDSSWKSITKYIIKFGSKIKAIRNPVNLGPGFNRISAEYMASGEYLLVLASDDFLDQNFLERVVKGLDSNKDCAFAIVHRDIVDSNGEVHSEAPFYNKTCRIEGPEQAAVYMMAAVNPSISQIVYRRSLIGYGHLTSGNTLGARWFAQRLIDFEICCQHPIIYIKEPLLKNRVHERSDGNAIDRSLIQPFGQYILIHQFLSIAEVHNVTAAIDRLPKAVEKVGALCLRYSAQFLMSGEVELSRKYFYLSLVLHEHSPENNLFGLLHDYHVMEDEEVLEKIGLLHYNDLSRRASYAPPEGHIEIEI